MIEKNIDKINKELQISRKLIDELEKFDTLVIKEDSGIDEKIVSLWIEIYKNACADRNYAQGLYADGLTKMSSGHLSFMEISSSMAKFLERMNKSNDQLLKLSEIILKTLEEKEQKSDMTEDDIFNQISGGK